MRSATWQTVRFATGTNCGTMWPLHWNTLVVHGGACAAASRLQGWAFVCPKRCIIYAAVSNGHVWPLKRLFTLELPYELVPGKDLALAIGGAAGEQSGSFDRRYPGAGGFIQLSAVGFNASKTKAIVQMTWICGWACGGGDTFVLDKENGRWGSPRSAFNGPWRF